MIVLLIRMSKPSNENAEKERIEKMVAKLVKLEEDKLKKKIKYIHPKWSRIVSIFFEDMNYSEKIEKKMENCLSILNEISRRYCNHIKRYPLNDECSINVKVMMDKK